MLKPLIGDVPVGQYSRCYVHIHVYKPTPGGNGVKVDFRHASLQDHHSSDTLGIFWIIHITHQLLSRAEGKHILQLSNFHENNRQDHKYGNPEKKEGSEPPGVPLWEPK